MYKEQWILADILTRYYFSCSQAYSELYVCDSILWQIERLLWGGTSVACPTAKPRLWQVLVDQPLVYQQFLPYQFPWRGLYRGKLTNKQQDRQIYRCLSVVFEGLGQVRVLVRGTRSDCFFVTQEILDCNEDFFSSASINSLLLLGEKRTTCTDSVCT